jgi:hypothetical protein
MTKGGIAGLTNGRDYGEDEEKEGDDGEGDCGRTDMESGLFPAFGRRKQLGLFFGEIPANNLRG